MNVQSVDLVGPGFQGLNTEVSPYELPPTYALEATNCVVDKFGRLTMRKGMLPIAKTATDDPMIGVWFYQNTAGTQHQITWADDGKFYLTSGNVLTEISVVRSDDGTTTGVTEPTTGDWSAVNFNDMAFFFQAGEIPLVWHDSGGGTFRLSPLDTFTAYEPPDVATGYTIEHLKGNHGVAAFGRLWITGAPVAPSLLLWSEAVYQSGGLKWNYSADTNLSTAGQLNLNGYWSDGFDEAVAVSTHNDFLIIFGKRGIIVYGGAGQGTGSGTSGVGGGNPNLTLQMIDTIQNTGLISKHGLENLGDELVFVSQTGIRSLGRLLQQKALPYGQITQNVQKEIQRHLNGVEDPKLTYIPEESLLLLHLNGINKVYAFDTRGATDTGGYRVTIWDTSPNLGLDFTDMVRWPDGRVFIANQYGLCLYDGYNDNGTKYKMVYRSPIMNMGDTSRIKMIKHIRPRFNGSAELVKIGWTFDDSGAEDWKYKTVYFSGNNAGYYGSDAIVEGTEWGNDVVTIDSYAWYGEYNGSSGTTNGCVRPFCSGTHVSVQVVADSDGAQALSVLSLNLLMTLGRMI